MIAESSKTNMVKLSETYARDLENGNLRYKIYRWYLVLNVITHNWVIKLYEIDFPHVTSSILDLNTRSLLTFNFHYHRVRVFIQRSWYMSQLKHPWLIAVFTQSRKHKLLPFCEGNMIWRWGSSLVLEPFGLKKTNFRKCFR